jgi:hypothetical protein
MENTLNGLPASFSVVDYGEVFAGDIKKIDGEGFFATGVVTTKNWVHAGPFNTEAEAAAWVDGMRDTITEGGA